MSTPITDQENQKMPKAPGRNTSAPNTGAHSHASRQRSPARIGSISVACSVAAAASSVPSRKPLSPISQKVQIAQPGT